MYGSGQQSRDWLYVDDHCRAIDLVLKKGVIGETYCVGGMHHEITNREVAEQICAALGKNPEESIVHVKDRPGHDFKYVVDWSKIQTELGWEPEADFHERLLETIRWFEANPSWWQRVKSGAYREYYAQQYADPE